jgi:hypothetical protein
MGLRDAARHGNTNMSIRHHNPNCNPTDDHGLGVGPGDLPPEPQPSHRRSLLPRPPREIGELQRNLLDGIGALDCSASSKCQCGLCSKRRRVSRWLRGGSR